MKQIKLFSTLDYSKAYLFYSNMKGDFNDIKTEKRMILFYFNPPQLGSGKEVVNGVFDLMTESWRNAININETMAVSELFENGLHDFEGDCLMFELDNEEVARHIIAEEI